MNPTILSTDEIYDVDGAESIEPYTELEDYNFDTSFFQRSDPDKNFDEGLAIFRLLHMSDGEDLYLHLYNIHNGYYGHGFKMSLGDEELWEGYL